MKRTNARNEREKCSKRALQPLDLHFQQTEPPWLEGGLAVCLLLSLQTFEGLLKYDLAQTWLALANFSSYKMQLISTKFGSVSIDALCAR